MENFRLICVTILLIGQYSIQISLHMLTFKFLMHVVQL